MSNSTDYGRPVRKSPSLQGQKSTPTPKFLGMAEAYFVRLPHWPIFSGIFDLCLHGVSVVRAHIALHVLFFSSKFLLNLSTEEVWFVMFLLETAQAIS